MADAALTLNETVREEFAVVSMCTEGLSSFTLLNIAVLPELLEDLLHNLCLLLSGCSAEDVKVDTEPVVDSLVKGVVLGAKVGGRKTLFKGLCLGSGTVLVGTTDVDSVVTSSFAVASKHVSRKNTADDVAQMRDVVDVGKGGGDEDVALALFGEDWCFGSHYRRFRVAVTMFMDTYGQQGLLCCEWLNVCESQSCDNAFEGQNSKLR